MPHQREAETCGPTSMAAGGRTELLANPTRRAPRCPPVRRLIALLVAVIALAMSAVPAAAARPQHGRLLPAAFPIFDSCEFGVFYEEVRVSGRSTTFFNADGNATRSIIRGNWVVELTNMDTEMSIRLNISGQFFIRGSFRAHGRNLLYTSFPRRFMVLAVGNVLLDTSNGLEYRNQRGRIVDICARLAG